MYNSRKVRWLIDRIQQAAHPMIPPGGGGDLEASHPPFANADTHRLYELNEPHHAPSLPVGTSSASVTPPATSQTRKRKRRLRCKDLQQYAPDGEVPQPTKCPHCERTFSGIANDQKSNLNRHVKHKHRHPYQASTHVCPECDQDFSRSDYLLKHRRDVHNLH